MSTVKVKEIQHPSNSNTAVTIAQDSSVSLNHGGSAQLTTSATGVTIGGVCTATSFSGSGLGVAATGGTFTGSVSFEDAINENVYALTGASATLDPDNGMIQTWTLSGTSTATDALSDGQSMLLLVTAGANSLAFSSTPAIKWAGGSQPALSATDVTAIELFKVGTQLYGAGVGDLS